MASLSTDKQGNRTIEFSGPDGSRQRIRLGKMPKRDAVKIKGHIENLLIAKRSGNSIDNAAADWLATTDGKLHGRLAKLGLVTPRVIEQASEPESEPTGPLLGDFTSVYINGRVKIKPGTRINLERCRRALVEYFGANQPMKLVTAGDADDFREHLNTTLAENTVRRICGRAKQIFRAAVRKKLLAESPFADMKAVSVTANKSREYFITREQAAAVLDACPNTQWKLLFALARYGGLRCPSEHLELRLGGY